MGLKGAPASFSRLMGIVLGDLPNVITYVDDAIGASTGHLEHLALLNNIADRLRKHNLKLNVAKCVLGRRSVSYLGHNVSAAGISPDTDKLKAVKIMAPPKDTKEVATYLGFFNYFRPLLHQFSRRSAPLSRLTRKDSKWKSGPLPPDALAAFNDLKQALLAEPVIGFPVPGLPYYISVDGASGREADFPQEAKAGGIGAILSQLSGLNGLEKVIAYWSRQLRRHEMSYAAFTLETLAIVDAIEHWSEYVLGNKVFVRTDHRPIVGSTRAVSTTKSQAKSVSRLEEKLFAFDVTLVWRPGKSNTGPDGLSRFAMPMAAVAAVDMAAAQKEDLTCQVLRDFLATGAVPADAKLQFLVKTHGHKLLISDDQLWLADKRKGQHEKIRLWVPANLVQSILQDAHGNDIAGHWKVDRTIARVAEDYYWPSMAADVVQFIDNCQPCQQTRATAPSSTRVPMCPWPQVFHFNARVHVDLTGPLRTEDGTSFVIVMTDAFTKWAELGPIPNKKATTVAHAIMKMWVTRYGCMLLLVSDGGKEFANCLMAEMSKLFGFKHHVISPLHPQAAGQVERFNRELKDYLRCLVDSTTLEWVPLLPFMQWSYNTAINRSTCHTPFRILFGQDCIVPWSPQSKLRTSYSQSPIGDRFRQLRLTHDIVAQNQAEAIKAYETDFNRKAKERCFTEGDKVLVHYPPPPGVNPKLHRPWQGPFVVSRRGDLQTVEVIRAEDRKRMTIHLNRVKLFNELAPSQEAQPQEHGARARTRHSPQAPHPPTAASGPGPRMLEAPQAIQEEPECADSSRAGEDKELNDSSASFVSADETIINNEVTDEADITPLARADPDISWTSSVVTRTPSHPVAPQSPPTSTAAPTPPAASTPVKAQVQPQASKAPTIQPLRTTRRNGVPSGTWGRDHRFIPHNQ
jgi:hypothetical protein